MLLPILAIGGAALGIWLLTRDEKEDAASDLAIKQPDPVTLASLDTQETPRWVVFVRTTNPDYAAVRAFQSWDGAYKYYKVMEAFFDEKGGYWTCNGGDAQIAIMHDKQTHSGSDKVVKTYTECKGRVMSKAQDPSDLLLELRDLTRDDSSQWPIVSCGVVVPDEKPWFMQWVFDPYHTLGCLNSSTEDKLGQECHAQREYFWYLFNAFTNKQVNDFYRPKGGLLYIHASGFNYEAAGGKIYQLEDATAVWDGNESALPGSDFVRPRLYRSGVLVR